ncbi:hypothetical protein ACOCJ7_14615 [Knoellia sp. CPCC 206453]|uniref:hypothetical protein n=1 Tax=Knoellia pratensis TaxID=3404796 RepID=UPI00361D5A0F
MPTDLWEYSKVLAEQLRLNGMKEEQVEEVVAEVQQHVLDTQQDPVEAFGQPTDYAVTWMAPSSSRRVLRILAAVAGVTSILALLRGLTAQGSWSDQVEIDSFYVSMWLIWVVALAVLPWTVEIWLARRRGQRVGSPGGVPLGVLLAGISALVLAVIWAGATMVMGDGGAVFSTPKWSLVLIGVLCLPGVMFIGSQRNAALPDGPGKRATWKTRVRRAFINR